MINVLLLVKRYTGNYPLLNEMARLDGSRFRCVVCYLDGDQDGQNPLDSLAKTYYFGLKNHEIKPWNARLRRRLADILDAESIHVVNCHLQRTIAVGVAAAKVARCRPAVLATLHGLGSAGSLQRKIGNWFLYRRLFKVIGVSEAVREDLLRSNWGLATDKVVTIHNGIDPTPFLAAASRAAAREAVLSGGDGGDCWFGSLGRLSEVKNQRSLLRAFARVAAVEPQVRLLLGGRGELEGELKALSSSLGIQEKVFFLGFRRDVPQILRALDFFVLPSLREGLPLSVMEAMCSGLPVLASRVGGIPELFGDVEMGTLVDPSDEAGLAEAMLALTRLPEQERKRLGDNARARALAHFTAEGMTRKYAAIYAAAFQDTLRPAA
jgi:glycosyltransferase involved in cell wall biosynthesis